MKKRILSLLMMLCVLLNLVLVLPVTSNASSDSDYVTVNLYTKKAIPMMGYSCIALGFNSTEVQIDSWDNCRDDFWVYTYGNEENFLHWALETDKDTFIEANTLLMSVTFKILGDNPEFYIYMEQTMVCDYINNYNVIEDLHNYVGIEVVRGVYRPVTNITLNPSSLMLKAGDAKRLQATCTPSNATNKTLTWSSSNTSVATVNSNGVVTAKTVGTSVITAKSNNGKTVGCIVTVKDRSVIDYDNFRYDFYNSGFSFGYPYHTEEINGEQKIVWDYSIPPERYLQAGLSKSEVRSGWGGNCFGMSTSSILFYKNALQEERYNSKVSKPIQFSSPDSDEDAFFSNKGEIKLRQMIELFQVSQYLPNHYNRRAFSPNKIVTELDNGNPVALGLVEKNGGGHRVVIYGYEMIGYAYKFYIYDCSNFVHTLFYANKDEWTFLYNDTTYTWSPANYITYSEIKNAHDYIKSKNNNNAISLFSLHQEPSYTYIFRPAENMTIVNSSNQISTITDGELAGEIENASLIPSSYLAEEPTYTIILPTDTYTIVGSSDEVITTSFAGDYMSASITAKSSTPITISSDLKEIKVDTTADEEYNIEYTTYDNIFDEMTLTGTATGTVSTILNDTDITVSGVSTLTASASVSDEIVSTTSNDLADCEKITVKCEETDTDTTIQILSVDTELTEKTTLPERLAVSAPTYDLESGTYTEGQTLTFTKDDETIVYYTTDGSIPSADNGYIYSLPIDINKSMTIKAISTKYGYSDSEVVELNYTLPEVAVPEANIESGEYDEIIKVELTTRNLLDEIYYTIDGSDPLENGILYTVPINISEDTYLQAYTLRNGCISEISEYDYVVSPSNPFYFSNSLTNQNGEIITSDNISELTKVKMTLSKLHSGEHSGLFLIAFYGENDKLLYVTSKPGTISEDFDEIEIDIAYDVSSAHKIKAFAWNDLSGIESICDTWEETIITG